MATPRRYLKLGLLRHFLRQAARFVGDEATLGLVFEDAPGIFFGPGAEAVDLESRDVLSLDIGLNGDGLGRLVLSVPGLSGRPGPERERAEAQLGFLSFCLHGFMELESARRAVGEEALAKYRELALLHRAVIEFNTTLRFKDVARALLRECRGAALPADRAALFAPTRSGNRFSPLEWFGFSDEQELSRIVDCSLFKEVVRSGKAEIVNELDQDPRWDCDLPSIRALLVLPLTSPNACQGCLVLASEGGSPFDSGHPKSLSVLAAVAGIALGNASNFEGIQTLMAAMLQALAEAIDSRDPYTAGHSERVALLVVAFAQLLNEDRSFPDIQFSEDQVREIYYAGILHDVGKIGVREDVLTKHRRVPEKLMEIIRLRLELFGVENRSSWIEDYERLKGINASTVTSPEDREFILELSRRYLETDGRTLHVLSRDERDSFLVHRGNLTLEERQEIERHPAESQRILQHIPFRKDFQDLLTIIRQHHERLDGSGYPDGLRGEDILVQSRMLSIVDIYDAIIQERHYKSASSKDQALSIIEDEAREGKLDHRLVQAFVRRIEEIEARAYSLGIEQLQTLSELHARTQGEAD